MRNRCAKIGASSSHSSMVMWWWASQSAESEIYRSLFDAGLRGIHRLPAVARKGCLLAYEYYIRLFEKIKALPASRIKAERIRVADWEKMFIYFQLALRK
ncbi:MAG: hypothetical protein ACKOUQ_00260 [Aquirufa sp.]